MNQDITLCLKVLRKTVTIPAAAGTAATLASLASLTTDEQNNIVGLKILGKCTDGSDRGAILVGDSTLSLPQYVASAADYSEPAVADHLYSYVRANSGAAIANVCVLFYYSQR